MLRRLFVVVGAVAMIGQAGVAMAANPDTGPGCGLGKLAWAARRTATGRLSKRPRKEKNRAPVIDRSPGTTAHKTLAADGLRQDRALADRVIQGLH